MKECAACKKRGQTWAGDPPKCAFTSGIFSDDNWNCATMNDLRDIAEEIGMLHRNDEIGSFGMVPFEDGECSGTIVLAWYKNRGRTEHAHFLTEHDKWVIEPLTVEIAEAAIRYWKERGKCTST